ncbi:unnamed protein product, partial [Polarella glacialis]
VPRTAYAQPSSQQSSISSGTPVMSASSTAPPGSGSRPSQVRLNPQPQPRMQLQLQQPTVSSAARNATITSPRRPGSPAKQHTAASAAAAAANQQQQVLARASRMRFSSAGRGYEEGAGRAMILTAQQEPLSANQPASAMTPSSAAKTERNGLAAKASACANSSAVGGDRGLRSAPFRSSSLDPRWRLSKAKPTSAVTHHDWPDRGRPSKRVKLEQPNHWDSAVSPDNPYAAQDGSPASEELDGFGRLASFMKAKSVERSAQEPQAERASAVSTFTGRTVLTTNGLVPVLPFDESSVPPKGETALFELILQIPLALIGKVIGKGATTLMKLKKQTGAIVDARDQSTDPVNVRVTGAFQAVPRMVSRPFLNY